MSRNPEHSFKFANLPGPKALNVEEDWVACSLLDLFLDEMEIYQDMSRELLELRG